MVNTANYAIVVLTHLRQVVVARGGIQGVRGAEVDEHDLARARVDVAAGAVQNVRAECDDVARVANGRLELCKWQRGQPTPCTA